MPTYTPLASATVVLPGGLMLTAVEEDTGVEWILTELGGWGAMSSTGEATQRAWQSGAWLSRAFYAGRVVTLKGSLYAPDEASAVDARERLLGSLPLTDPEVMQVTEGGVTLQAAIRQDTDQDVSWLTPTSATFDLQLFAPDPRRVSLTEHTASTGLPLWSGGLMAPFTVPFTIDAEGSAGVLRVVNAGTADAPATIRLDGPLDAPFIRHEESGSQLAFDLTVTDGQWLVIDLDAHTVKLNGQASRRGQMRGEWFTLTPGLNTISWGAASGGDDSLLTVTWRDAWR